MTSALWTSWTAPGVLEGAFDPKLVVRRAEGCFLELAGGRRVLDGSSGLWNNALGYGRPDLITAMRDAMERLSYHCPLHALPEIASQAAEALLSHAPPSLARVMFHSTGTAAVESAVLIARQYFALRGEHSKKEIISFERSFHGASLLGATMSGLPEDAAPYAPLAPGFHHVPLYDEPEPSLAALDRLLLRADRIAALVYEPIAAVAGVIVPPPGFMARVRDRCRAHDVLLIADEVTTGLGRTGAWFASADHDPDVVLVGKTLGAGHAPISAGLYRREIFELFSRTETIADVASTMDGQAAPCAVALAVLRALERERLVERAAAIGEALLPRLARLEGPIGAPRGRGLMIGIPTVGIDKRRLDGWLRTTFADGLLLHRAGTTLTLFPPLTIRDDEVELLLQALARALPRLSPC